MVSITEKTCSMNKLSSCSNSRPSDPKQISAMWMMPYRGGFNSSNPKYKVSSGSNSRTSDPKQISAMWMMPYCGGFNSSNPKHSTNTPGKKRAVLCGVSYLSQRLLELKGTINDVKSMKSLLTGTFGFTEDSIHILTEYETDPQNIPNRLNIQRELMWLIRGCQSGDSLVFYYSGHGSRLFNFNGDEIDGFDETLCPVDYRTNGMITANELNNTIVRPLPKGAVLHAIIDACHSGTVLDLPYYCSMNREGVYEWAEDRRPATGSEKGTDRGLAICLSSCADHQVSADTDMTGAMTYTLIKLLEREPNMTYDFLLNAIRDALHDIRIGGPLISLVKRVFNFGSPQVPQGPQLTSSERFDIHTKWFTL